MKVQKLMSFETACQFYGRLVSREEISKELGISSRTLIEYLNDGAFNGLYLIVDKDVTVQDKTHFKTNSYIFMADMIENFKADVEEMKRQRFISRIKKAKDYAKDGLIRVQEAAARLGISVNELISEMKDGKWDDYIFRHTKNRPYEEQTFKYKEMYRFFKYHPLTECINILKHPKNSVYRYNREGMLMRSEQLKKVDLWDPVELQTQIAAIKTKSMKQNGISNMVRENRAENMLNKQQRETIEAFLKHRIRGTKIKWEGVVYYNKPMINPKSTALVQRQQLSKFLFDVIRVRCGISELEGRMGFNKVLSDEQKKLFDPDVLDIHAFDLNDHDIDAHIGKLMPSTQFQYGQTIRAFLYFLLMKLEKQYPLWLMDEKQRLIYYPKRLALLEAVFALPSTDPEFEGKVEKKYKTFLTPEETIRVYEHLMSKYNYERSFYTLKKVVSWMLSAFVGIRPEEQVNLRIEHFVLDKNGLLRKGKYGYGILRLPAKDSKKHLSPSHLVHGTLIVPSLVNLLNTYIEVLYTYQHEIGMGYLIRPYVSMPEIKTNKLTWATQEKKELTFLPEKRRSGFEIKTGRRSLRNLMAKTPVTGELYTNKERLMELQMRHNIRRISGSVGFVYYTEEVPFDLYLEMVDATLNFPWDIDALQDWKSQHGYGEDWGKVMDDDVEAVINNFYYDEDKEESENPAGTPKKSYQKNRRVLSKEAIYEKLNVEAEKLLNDSFKKINKAKMDNVFSAKEATEKLAELESELKILQKTQAKKLGISIAERTQRTNQLKKEIALLNAQMKGGE